MYKLMKSFQDSFHELKDIRALATTAMFLAIAVVLGFYSLQVTDFIKISFSFIADEMTGMMFGPMVGAVMGAAADLVKYLVHPTGAFFPGFTISGAISGMIYGMILYKKPLHVRRILLANGLVMVFVNILLNTYWLTLLYGQGFMAILPVRVLKEIILYPIYVALFYSVSKVMKKTHVLMALRGKRA